MASTLLADVGLFVDTLCAVFLWTSVQTLAGSSAGMNLT